MRFGPRMQTDLQAANIKPSGLALRDQAALQAERPRARRLAAEPPGDRHRGASPENGEPRQGADQLQLPITNIQQPTSTPNNQHSTTNVHVQPRIACIARISADGTPPRGISHHEGHRGHEALLFVPTTGPSRFFRPRTRTEEPRARATYPRYPRHPWSPPFVPFASFVVQ